MDSDILTTGSQNIVIGSLTRTSGGGNTNSIVIGYDIDAASEEFAFGRTSNKVYNGFGVNNAWTRSSDIRLKTNIKPVEYSGLDFVNELNPITFNWKSSNEVPKDMEEYNEENQMNTEASVDGMIAQEVKEAMDKCGIKSFGGWSTQKSGTQSLSREMFIYPLIKAMQELSTKVEEQQKEIEELKK